MSSTNFHPLQPFLPKRKTLLLRSQQAINIPPPQKVEIQLESGHQVSVMRNSFVHLLQEHLVSPVSSDLSNLDLPSSSDPFSSKPSSIPSHTSLIDSRWYVRPTRMLVLPGPLEMDVFSFAHWCYTLTKLVWTKSTKALWSPLCAHLPY
jgi:hypothetical protein